MKWQTKKFGDVCDIINGSTPLRSNKDFWDNGDVPWFTIDDIREQGRIIKYTNQRITQNALGKISSRLLPAETVLLCCTASVGEYAITEIPITTNQQFNGLVVKNKKYLDPMFLFYFSATLKDQLLELSGKTTIDFIPISRLKGIEISYPESLAEQKRIVKILDEVFLGVGKARENAEKNLKNSQELFESYLQDIFANSGKDWEKKRLGEVCDFTQGIQIEAKLQSETRAENQVRFLRIIDFTQGNELPRYINNPGEKYIIGMNDVSLVRYGASTGFVCKGLEGVLANNLFRVIPKNKKEITNDYLFIFLKSPAFQNIIRESMSGTAMPAISFGLIKDIPTPIMSIPEQKAIVKKLDALSGETKKLEAIFRRKIASLDELKKSILKQAFAGEL